MGEPSSELSETETFDLWILLEGDMTPESYSFRSERAQPNLSDLRHDLMANLEPLHDLKVSGIGFFAFDDRVKPIRLGTLVADVNNSIDDEKPLVVRYRLSDATVIGRCNLSTSWDNFRFPHTTGGWYELKKVAERKFEELEGADYWFVDNDSGEKICDEFQFNDWLGGIQPTGGKCIISVRVEIQGRKAYSDWKLGDITAAIIGTRVDDVGDLTNITLNDLPKYTGDISKETLDGFIMELQVKLAAFKSPTNESVVREFVSPFMSRPVRIMQEKYPDLILKAEEKLKGTRGYGPIDYSVKMHDIVILVTEAKNENFTQGAAQNIAQIHSAVEDLEKKRKVTDDDVHRAVMYGIVTTGTQWVFIRWGGKSKNPKIQLTQKVSCSFEEFTIAKEILSRITGIIENQLESLDNPSKRAKVGDSVQG